MAEKVKYLFLILITVIYLNNNISAKEGANLLEEFKTANNLYEKADYASAIEKYRGLIDKGIKNESIYYNLGNAYYKTDKLGEAVLNYKRASKLSPRDKDIIANLTFVREKVVDQIGYEKPFSQIVFGKIISILTFDEWTILCGILYLSFMSLAIFCVFKRDVSAEVKFYKNSIFVILCVTLVFFISSYLTGKRLEAVITAEEVDVKNGPGENYSKGFVLHEGAEVYIENGSGDWLEIVLSNGLKGWIEKDFCGRI